MKWGVRRYQNKDGSLTPAGKKKYRASDAVRFKDASTGKKFARSAVAGATVGLGKHFLRFSANHKMGTAVANGILAGALGAIRVKQGWYSIPGAVVSTGASFALGYGQAHLNDIIYRELYTKK